MRLERVRYTAEQILKKEKYIYAKFIKEKI